ncbi:MAG: hypothetical protein EXS63_03850 [Candidatus Omnitrophica bacterium]|nr:hypothetical protein [Candidatus Omnitrophota bacterium]
MKLSPKVKSLLSKRTILHIVTGSVAAYKIGDLIQDLRMEGARVLCVMTSASRHFVTPLVLRALSGNRVYEDKDFFTPDTPYDVLHTSLAEEADVVLIAPASADFIANLRAGMADNLASCIVLAARRPVVIVPAMNDQMYQHPITQENISRLKAIGYHFVEPVQGHLVCGKEAIGHIAETTTIISSIRKTLGNLKSKIRNPKF